MRWQTRLFMKRYHFSMKIKNKQTHWLIVSIIWIFLSIQLFAFGQTVTYEAEQIIVTFDCSGSMKNFPHERLGEYAAKILFEGISRSDISAKDQINFRRGIIESDFERPLLQPESSLDIYRFSQKIKKVEILSDTRDAFLSVIPGKRDCAGKTDIASVVEYACSHSEKSKGQTLWVFISDDKPFGRDQKGQQAARLRLQELWYEWDPIFNITIGDADDPPLVEVRHVHNRMYDRYREIEKLLEEGKNPDEITQKLNDLNENIKNILEQMKKHLPESLIRQMEERINELNRKANEELYLMKLGIFELKNPGVSEKTSRFIEGGTFLFSWTKPDCQAISHFVLRIRDVEKKTIKDYETDKIEYQIPAIVAGQ